MSLVVIVDYGLCNLDSIRRAVQECGGRPLVSNEAADVKRADHLVLPGVGAFPDAMANLRRDGVDQALADSVLGEGVPFLGICLGMQLLASMGEEFVSTEGLGWVDATVTRLTPEPGERVPHVGWNAVSPVGSAALFEGIADDADFYFVHSFHLSPTGSANIAATTPYGGGFVSAVERDNVFGVQFHPEKSQQAGFALLRNFLQC